MPLTRRLHTGNATLYLAELRAQGSHEQVKEKHRGPSLNAVMPAEGCTEKCKTSQKRCNVINRYYIIAIFSNYRFVVLLVTSDTLGPALTKLQAGGLLQIPMCSKP